MNTYDNLFDFIRRSPSAYHAVDTVAKALISHGFTELYEVDSWRLIDGEGYFIRRDGSSIIAFVYHKGELGFNVVSSHSDSPSFRLKLTDTTVGAYTRLEVEKYGGMLYYCWLDRPLSVAGRVAVKSDGGLDLRLVDLDYDGLVIPSLAIHMNREANDGLKLNPARDMLPVYSTSSEPDALMDDICSAAGCERGEILSHDLFLYCREAGRAVGRCEDMILCPRLDDLGCVFTSLEAFISTASSSDGLIPVLAVFNNEEVGSETKQGAASGFMYDVLSRVCGSEDELRRRLCRSFMVSADNAHARHPNRPDVADPDNAPLLNKGIVIKFNANQRYATDGISDGVFRTICRRAGVPVQNYYNRADMMGGSTLGSISNTRVSLYTVDIGLPQLAMHSAVETAGACDLDYMIKALAEFYKTPMLFRGCKVDF